MAESTITGRRGTKAHDARKMEQLRVNIFLLLNDDEFSELWKDCKSAIASACKTLRSNELDCHNILCGHFVNIVSWITNMHILPRVNTQVDAFTSVHLF